LGSAFFLISINDFPDCHAMQTLLFADDTALITLCRAQIYLIYKHYYIYTILIIYFIHYINDILKHYINNILDNAKKWLIQNK